MVLRYWVDWNQVRAGVKEMNLHGQTDGAQDRSPPVAIPGGPHKTRIAMPKNVLAPPISANRFVSVDLLPFRGYG